MKLPALSTVALSLFSFVSTPARAQEPPPPPPPTAVSGPPAPGGFGSQGQLVINTDIPLHQTEPEFSLIHESTSMGRGSATRWGIVPSLDYFVAPNVSVGGTIGIIHEDLSIDSLGVSGVTMTAIEVGARVGYNVPFSDAFSLWPRLSLAYERVSVSGGTGNDSTGYLIPLTIFAPVLWHPAQHFFVGLGPVFSTQLTFKIGGVDQAKTTDFGIQAILGGYFTP